MFRKIVKGLLALSIAAILLCAGILSGGRFQEEYQQEQEQHTEATRKIAVVNLDSGVEIDGKKTYYAQNMMMLPNDNFSLTNLEDARTGIKNGVYAAYIMVPVTFSDSIESINGTPVKATLTYEMNENLKTSIKPEVLKDLHEFQALLSENTTYIYVSAILREYHKAQDDSKIVMKNGDTNIDAVKNINPSDLFVQRKYTDFLTLDFTRADLDVDRYLNDNSRTSNQMNEDFRSMLTAGQESFDDVKNDHSEVEQEIEKLTGYVDDMKVSQDVYADGLSELNKVIDQFNDNINSKRNWVKEELASQSNAARTENQNHVNSSLANIIAELQSRLDTALHLFSQQVQNLIDEGIAALQNDNYNVIHIILQQFQIQQDEAYEQIRQYVDIRLEEINQYYEMQANEKYMELIEEVKADLILSENGDSETDSLLASLSNATIQLATSSDAWIDMNEAQHFLPTLATPDFALKNAVAAELEDKDEVNDFWIKIPFLNFALPERSITLPPIDTGSYDLTVDVMEGFYHISTEEIEQVLTNNVIGVIETKTEEDYLNLREVIEEFNSKTDKYQNTLDEYNPYEYVETSFLSKSLKEIEQNLRELERGVSEKSREEERLVNDIHRTASENTTELEKNMDAAYEESQDNVIRTVQALRSLQEKNHEQDTNLLQTFTRQLSYTRVGSVGNRSVYDFISNPILLTSGNDVKNHFFQLDTGYRTWAVVAMIGFGSGVFVLGMIYIVLRVLNKRQRREDE